VENLPELVAGYQDSLFAFLYRMCGDADLAEELMQETFVRALRAAGRYQPDALLTTWLFQIAANLLRDRWRQQAGGESLPPLTRWNCRPLTRPRCSRWRRWTRVW
jgi:RNA polymerase sigma factor (sigma-70 family)